MDEFDEFSEHRAARLPGQRLGEWARANRIIILYGLLLVAVMFSRGLWGPDERRMADLIHDALDRSTHAQSASAATVRVRAKITCAVQVILLRPLMSVRNRIGQFIPAQRLTSGSSAFHLWLAKGSVILVRLFGGGSAPEYMAWPLRLPSVLGSILFLYFFKNWASRFLQSDVAGLATLILCATPLWFWQSQALQVDLLFSAMLGWSWLCWLAGYLLFRHQVDGSENEHHNWFGWSNVWLGLAFLMKGPLPLLLATLLILLFLMWQKDLMALKETVMHLSFLALFIMIISSYVFGLFWLPGFQALSRGFLRVQPIWIYAEYLVRDLFPWVLLLPALMVFLRGSGAHKAPIVRFLMLAFMVPLLISIWGDGTRGADPLVAYPFLALLLAGLLQPVQVEGVSATRIRRIGAILAVSLWMAALGFFAVSMIRLGGPKIQGLVTPMLGSLRLATFVLAMGAFSVSVRCALGEGKFLVRETAVTVCVVFFIIGTWGFHHIDKLMWNKINLNSIER